MEIVQGNRKESTALFFQGYKQMPLFASLDYNLTS